MRYKGIDYPDDKPKQLKPTLKPLPCPFCGRVPQLSPKRPQDEGNAWGEVWCANAKCVQPNVRDGCDVAGEYGSGWYIDQAIKRWNTRQPPKAAPGNEPESNGTGSPNNLSHRSAGKSEGER